MPVTPETKTVRETTSDVRSEASDPRQHRVAQRRAAGNRAAALLAIGQAKLEVGAANDVFEREADDVAERVVAALSSRSRNGAAPSEAGGEATSGGPVVQRVRQVQRKDTAGAAGSGDVIGAEGGAVGSDIEGSINAARSGGQVMPDAMRKPMESAFGSSFGDVKVHTGGSSDQLNEAVSAKAFTVGTDIFVKGGMPANNTEGQRLMAHELTHVVQQRGGETGAQRVIQRKNPFSGMFGKKKKGKGGDPTISGPTATRNTTGEALVKMVQSADQKTRALMAKDGRFLAKVAQLDEGQKAIVMGLLESATKAETPEPTMSSPVVVDAPLDTPVSSTSVVDAPVSVKPSVESLPKPVPEVDHEAEAERERELQEKAQLELEGKEREAAKQKAEEERVRLEDEERQASEAKAKEVEDERLKVAEQERAAETERLRLEQVEKDRLAEVERVRLAEVERLRLEAEEKERQRIAKEDLKYKTTSEVQLLKLPALLKYVVETPTWDQRSTITDEDKAAIRAVLAFAALPGVASSLGAFGVLDIRSETGSSLAGTLAEVIADLKVYVQAASANVPFSLNAASTVLDARQKGNALRQLLAVFPAWVLKSAMTDTVFNSILSAGRIQKLIDYYTTSVPKPIFQADGGDDFKIWNIAHNEGWDPGTMHTTELGGKIRNFHRFEFEALKRLRKNFASGNVKNLPLTLILHASIDHNGAFHRDPLLTDVIKNPNTFTLLIEGGESLGAYQSQIGPLAAGFGVNGKIDQVMFAGHGNAQIIQMAGTVEQSKDGGITEKNDMIGVGDGSTEALFNEILGNMHKDAEALLDPAGAKYRRILFNACLTNSNDVNVNLDSDDTKARAQITEYIKNNASLATFLGQKAKKDGYGGVKSLGANASIGQVELAKPSGELDLVSPEDPWVTSGKLEYAEHGEEPLGVMRACLEAWAIDPAATFDAMQRRVAVARPAQWDDAIIVGIYKQLLTMKAGTSSVGQNIKQWVPIAGDISEMKHDAHLRVGEIGKWLVGGWEAVTNKLLLGGLIGTAAFQNENKVRMVWLQIYMRCNPSDGNGPTEFLKQLENNFDAKTAMVGKGKYVDVPFLVAHNLLTPLLAGPASRAKTVLATIALLDGGAPQAAKDYFSTKLDPGAPEIPELAEVPAVAEIPESEGPRAKIDKVLAVPGRLKVDAIPGHRVAAPAIPDLEELPELAAVTDVGVSGPVTSGGKGPKVVAPGRKGRDKRELVPKVAQVKPFMPVSLKFEISVGKRATEDEILKKLA